ncbi:MAG: helix-turn-helix domain-containing protein [Patescibacteria group bacterium]|nr:helix-turn-helix domain-containing protein [Patescibacteria group bacterium]
MTTTSLHKITNTPKSPVKRTDKQIWLSVSESAKMAGVDGKTIRRAIKNKKLRYKVSGNRYAIRLFSLIEFSHENAKLRNKFYTQGLGQYVEKFKKNIITK